MNKKVKRRVLFLVLFFGIVLSGTTISGYKYFINIYQKKVEKKELIQKQKELKEEEKILKEEVKKMKDPDYIARYAREKYLYSKEGEIIIQKPN